MIKRQEFYVQGKSSSGGITYTYVVRVTENEIIVATNQHDITIESILRSSYSGLSFAQYGVGVETSLNDEQIYSEYKANQKCAVEETYYTWNGLVEGNDDGTLSLEIDSKFWMTASAYYTPPKEMKIEGVVFEGTKIDRPSKISSVSGTTIGENMSVAISKVIQNTTHTLYYRLVGKEDWIKAAEEIDTEASFLLPKELCNDITQSDTAELELRLDTYLDGVYLDQSSKLVSIEIPAYVIPSIQNVNVTELNTLLLELTNQFIQGVSKLNLKMEGISGAYGSTITNTYFIFESQKYTGSNVNVDVVGSGEITLKAIAVDSRSRSYIFEKKITVLSYMSPKFDVENPPTATRRMDITSTVDIVLNIDGSSILEGETEINAVHVYVLPKELSATYYPSLTDDYRVLSTSSVHLDNYAVSLLNVNPGKSYNLKLVLLDNFGGRDEWELKLGTEVIVLDRNRYGLGVQKRRERGALDVHGEVYTDSSFNGVSLEISKFIKMGTHIMKRYSNGVWYGNTAPLDDESETFESQNNYYGMFFSNDGKVYSVKGTDMQDIHTGGGKAVFA